MGSCVSKSPTKTSSQPSQSLQGRKNASNEKTAPRTGDDSREAAAVAAEKRLQAQQQNTKSGQDRLKAMEKVSRKDKGLA